MAARRPRRPASQSIGIPEPVAPGNPTIATRAAGRTGRYLILMEPSEMAAGGKALTSVAGLKMTSVAGTDAEAAHGIEIAASEGLTFHDLGVAVVNSPPDQVASVSAAVASSPSLRLMEPERFVYAIGGLDVAYLRGYRDAVNQLVDTMLGGSKTGDVTTSVAAASFDETSLAWGYQAVGAANSRFTGKGVKLAVLDTGLDLTHSDFTGRVVQSKSFVAGAPTVQDGHGHGTHCAGIACGSARPSRLPRFAVAPGADLFVGKVLDDAGSGTDGDILAGIQWALASGCDIVSMSLGGATQVGESFSAIFEQAAARCLSRGCLLIAAAGNDSRRPQSPRPVSHPANCPSIIAVGAVDSDFDIAPFSNAGLNPDGGQVDIAGPGVEIISNWPTPELYKIESGTSMATPHVAGVAALFAEQNPGIRGNALLALMTRAARRLPASSADVGVGLVQAP